jgi:hypothetical protein
MLKANQPMHEPYRSFCFFIQIAFPGVETDPVHEVATLRDAPFDQISGGGFCHRRRGFEVFSTRLKSSEGQHHTSSSNSDSLR